MDTQFIHNVELGFLLWADNRLCNKGQAYTTVSTKLYPMEDDRLPPTYVRYSSPFKEWVYDSGVQGAIVPHSISGSQGVISEGQSGMQFDYSNGGVIFTGGNIPRTLDLTGTYSFKDFNIYSSNDSWESLISEKKYYLNSRFNRQPTGIQPWDLVTPAIFVNASNLSSKALAFGGLKDFTPNVSMLILAENKWQLDGVMSVFQDSQEKYFPILPMSTDPIQPYGNLKSGYDYSVIARNANQNDYVFIESVKTSALSDRIKVIDSLYAGVVNFQLSAARLT